MAKGVKTGGRKPGTPNKATAARQAEVAASGLTPLEYMLNIMRDAAADPSRRDDMAKAAAPYVHPRLSTVTADVDAKVASVNRIELVGVPSGDGST